MIHIVQCLCPSRHCILALAYQPGDMLLFAGEAMTVESAVSYLRIVVEKMIEDKRINPWCGICQSRAFTYEDGVTRFQTLKEANKELKRSESEQEKARRYFASGRN